MALKHVKRLNRGRALGEAPAVAPPADPAQAVVAQQSGPTMGCAVLFAPGWETDAFWGVFSLCHPWQRDIYGCSEDCWWPAQVPDTMTSYPGFSDACNAVEKDWQNITFIE